ncbi:hypothetical protein ScPMuIL_001474 [Solemya velum]
MAATTNENVEVREIDYQKGRGLFSNKAFKKEDIIFEEEPLVCAQFVWNKFYHYTACEYCLRSLETAEEMGRRLTENSSLILPYPECCGVNVADFAVCKQCQAVYCNEECLKQAWTEYHQVLCMGSSCSDSEHPLNKLQEIWRNIHMPPESSSIMLVSRMVAMVKQAKDRPTILNAFTQFSKATENEETGFAHKLLGKQFEEQLELLRQMTKEALYEDEIQQWFTPEGFKSLFALIGRNSQGIGSSSISVWVQNCDKLDIDETERQNIDEFIDQLYEDLDRVSADFLNCEGTGLYQLQSLCNHSCTPNVEVTFPHGNHRLALTALQDIPPGEELCISYLDECTQERSRHSRQRILRENYLFQCICPKCLSQADDPDLTSEEEEEMDEGDEGVS